MKTTIIIVVYKSKLKDSHTFTSLLSVLSKDPSLKKDLTIVIYDNSPEKQEMPFCDQVLDISYVHDPRNLGLATAYNYAYQLGINNQSEWLLLLDHDTTLNLEYVNAILKSDKSDLDNKIVAVVPKIISKNTMISPVMSDTLLPLLEERPTPGIQNTPVMAINSGSLIKIDFLNQIGGFTEEFPLDYLDHWLFYKIYQCGYKTLLLDVELHHDLSVMDFKSISITRYRSILDSEIKFYKNYHTYLFPDYRKLLMKRLIIQMIGERKPKIAAYTFRRLFSLYS